MCSVDNSTLKPERFAPIKVQIAKRRRTVRPIGSIDRPTWLITREISQKYAGFAQQEAGALLTNVNGCLFS
ncbi:hypothetical protein [Bradyrhizobium sp. NBAIM08]|uniref:hypothetical protein n=1 Tax=Bradyrhizobium sp. NBAIM08 TaxID=2793815 RepID=UPI001CD518A4|nr:hypothetical protein [Bradyrhizobium sp. NBAIM08]MCA1474770.1 hypothetical protein [Bradyrhizobium sp. NBAIM08]